MILANHLMPSTSRLQAHKKGREKNDVDDDDDGGCKSVRLMQSLIIRDGNKRKDGL